MGIGHWWFIPADFLAKLGVTEQQLKDALGVPPRPPAEGDRPESSANR
ncbi:hypothetical protein H6G41_13480 [Tolypothrix sp. FACHB-123]|nr:hypothetical protein [Tolypothrix sp. FACHB-123]MBD2355615.1 hypothetical protein [Tolypothrix sp. FACHB-123]